MRYLNSIKQLLLFFSLLFLFSACQLESQKADLIIMNASIWTGNENQPWAEAMAIAGDTIISIGSIQEVSIFKGKETVIKDISGKFVTPGFIDSHVHFIKGGFNLNSVQLRDASTPEEFKRRIGDYAKKIPKGSWILGGDWDHENWGGELPSKKWIDDLTPDNPVFINRLDGHMSLANSVALKLAGVDRNTLDIEGGEIKRNKNGDVTGLFKDNAERLIRPFVPKPSEEEYENALHTAMNYVASNGVTSVHHMSASDHLDVLKKAQFEGELITRIYAMFPLSEWKSLNDEIDQNGRGNKWLKVGGLKGFVDGSLGSHTAAFFEPYMDTPGENGLFVTPMENIYRDVKAADKANLQIMIHAIGDKANHDLLNTFEKVEKENGSKDRRFRIEHAQHLISDDIARFSKLGIIPSMQPYISLMTEDGRRS